MPSFGALAGWGGLPVEAAKSSADAGGREASSARGPLPGFTEVFCKWPGESELGVGDDDQPGPAIGGCGLAEFGNGPAQRLLDHPEGMFKIEPAQEPLPESVDIPGRCTGAGPPQPDRPGVAVPAQVLHAKTDDGAFDDRSRPSG